MYVPFAGGWRIDLQLFDEDDREYYGSEEGVREWLPKVIDPKYAEEYYMDFKLYILSSCCR